MRRMSTLGVIVAVCATACVCAGDGLGSSTEFREAESRIADVAGAGKSASVSRADLDKLSNLAEEVERTWRTKDSESYGHLMVQICGAFGSVDSLGPWRLVLAQTFALRALERAGDLPLEVECALIRHVQANFDEKGARVEGTAGQELRRKMTLAWLHGWQRIERTIDPNWDASDAGVGNVAPPGQAGLPPGIDPSAVTDPALRARYVADIEANRAKIAKATLQIHARDLKKLWVPTAERFIISAYMVTDGSVGELEAMLKEYIQDENARTLILDAVRKQEMPTQLQLRNSTQPASQP